jgi:hypothetical protein
MGNTLAFRENLMEPAIRGHGSAENRRAIFGLLRYDVTSHK